MGNTNTATYTATVTPQDDDEKLLVRLAICVASNAAQPLKLPYYFAAAQFWTVNDATGKKIRYGGPKMKRCAPDQMPDGQGWITIQPGETYNFPDKIDLMVDHNDSPTPFSYTVSSVNAILNAEYVAAAMAADAQSKSNAAHDVADVASEGWADPNVMAVSEIMDFIEDCQEAGVNTTSFDSVRSFVKEVDQNKDGKVQKSELQEWLNNSGPSFTVTQLSYITKVIHSGKRAQSTGRSYGESKYGMY
jgi:hypothetical protein